MANGTLKPDFAPDFVFGTEQCVPALAGASAAAAGQRARCGSEGRNGVWLAQRGLGFCRSISHRRAGGARARQELATFHSRTDWPTSSTGTGPGRSTSSPSFHQFASPAQRGHLRRDRRALKPGGLHLQGLPARAAQVQDRRPSAVENPHRSHVGGAFADFSDLQIRSHDSMTGKGGTSGWRR